MDHYIVTERSKAIRAIARQALKGNWFNVAVATAIYSFFTAIVSQIVGYFFHYDYNSTVGTTTQQLSLDYGSGIYEFVLLGAFTLGLATFFVNFLRTRKTDCSLIFEGFSNFGKSFFLNLLIAVKVFLWSLLFIVPGIIATIRYSQAYYVLVDHPEYKVGQCIEESKRLTYGNKSKIFCLDLSFIGWILIATVPNSIYNSLYLSLNWNFNFWLNLLIVAVCYIPVLFVLAYMETSNVVVYDLASQRLKPINEETDK